ncbi:MAG: hypothetical protein EON60_04240 [Alphaproteobacteria bacterium]|nr:MAG: hypothetical protein EON60_04240 [Alphaproteobacteria bacterium]
MKKTIMMALLACLPLAATHAQEAVSATAPYPWFGSLKKTEVNVRSGPGNQYPILWVYQRAGYPVEVLAKYDNYYKLRDVEGEEGWVYIGMVSRKPTGLVGGKTPSNLMRRAEAGSQLVARLAPGVVVEMGECRDVTGVGNLCEVETPGAKGYVLKSHLDMVP